MLFGDAPHVGTAPMDRLYDPALSKQGYRLSERDVRDLIGSGQLALGTQTRTRLQLLGLDVRCDLVSHALENFVTWLRIGSSDLAHPATITGM